MNESIDADKSQNKANKPKPAGEEDEDNDCESLIKLHRAVAECSLMVDGYHTIKRKYYFCSCDPDCQMPLCTACLNKCHAEHWKNKELRELITDKRNALCFCGLRNHILLEGNTKGDFVYNSECQFLEWSIYSKSYVCYIQENNPEEILCSFCYNCNKISQVGFERKTDEELCKEVKCMSHHEDYLSIFEKIKELVRHEPFKFEGLNRMQFFNMILMSKASFENAYHRVFSTLKVLETDLLKKKKTFDFTLYINNSPFMKAIENMKELIIGQKNLFYATKIIDISKFILPLMQRKFNYKSQENIWILKSNLFNIFHRANFRKYLEPLPILTLQDLSNMNPFQRIMYCDYINIFPEINEKLFTAPEGIQKNYIDDLLRTLDKYKVIKNKGDHAYNILKLIYSQIKKIVRFNKLTNEQAMKLYTLNDDLIYSSINERSKDPINGLAQARMLYQMVEVILYMAYNYNDTQLRKYLSGELELNQISFFHGNNETSKMIYKNTAHILLYARTIHKKYVTDETPTEDIMNISEKMNQSESLMSAVKLKKTIEKLHDRIMFMATDINSLTLNYPDAYLFGLKRLLDAEKSIYQRFIENQLSPKEEGVYNKLKSVCLEIEKTYQDLFEFNVNLKDVENLIITKIQEVIEYMQLNDEDFIQKDQDTKKEMDTTRKRMSVIASIFNGKKNEDFEKKKLRILINKTPIIYTMVKSIEILVKSNKEYIKDNSDSEKENSNNIINNSNEDDKSNSSYSSKSQESENNPIEVYQISKEYVESLFKFLSFYVKDSPDNCLFVVTDKVLETFMKLNTEYIDNFIDLLEYIIKTLMTNNIQLSQNNMLMRVVKFFIEKISGKKKDISCLQKLLKIISKLSKMTYLHQEHTMNKIRKTFKEIYLKNPVLQVFRNVIIPNSDPMEERDKTLKDMIDEKEMIEGYPVKTLCILFTKFLKIINYLFDGNSTLNETVFLEKIFTKEQIPKILKDLTLYLPLRIEIIKFYRMVYIDIIIDCSKINDYVKIFAMDIKTGIDENANNFILFQELLRVKEANYSPDTDCELLNFEMKNFPKIISYNGDFDQKKILLYYKDGVILPLSVFINTYISIIYNLDGYQYIKLHELVLHFLMVKKYIIEQSSKKQKQVDEEVNKGGVFKGMALSLKNRFSLLHFEAEHIVEINKDLEEINSLNLEILNYKKMYNIFIRNAKKFIEKEEVSSLAQIFNKNNGSFTDEEIESKKEKYTKSGLLNEIYGQKVFYFTLKYEKDKSNFNESALGVNLAEKNVLFDKTYRFIMLKPIFYLINRHNLYLKYRRQNLFHIFRLLQCDTDNTQQDILSLLKEDIDKLSGASKKNELGLIIEEDEKGRKLSCAGSNFEKKTTNLEENNSANATFFKAKSTIDLNYLINIFIQNLLSVIFDSCNPSSIPGNEDYLVGYTIIKILKYMCEDHNLKFQTIFFQDIKINYGGSDNMNLFDLMMCTLDKILIFAKWDEVDYDTEEDKISYFYDLFFCMVELSIEMIQGTSEENCNKIIEQEGRANEKSFFYKFLLRARNVLKNDNNNSEIVYKARIDIISFVQAFLEEKSTPRKIIMLIENLMSPMSICDSVIFNLKKLYAKTIGKEISKADEIEFDDKLSKIFIEKYFSDNEFSQNSEFELANNMYHYIKALNNFKNKDAINIIDCTKIYTEEQILNLKDVRDNGTNDQGEDSESILIDKRYFQIFFCVKFFEAITKCVWVLGEGEKFPQPVLFTLDPTVLYLSNNSKNSFIQEVPRDTRASKLFALMEYTNYFFIEINQNKKRLSSSTFLRLLNLINYDYLDLIIFLLIGVINIIIFLKAQSEDAETNYESLYNLIFPIAIVQIILTGFALLCWFLSKFSLHYTIEKEKYYTSHRLNKEEKLSFIQDLDVIILKTILSRREIVNFIWDLIVGIIGLSSSNNLFIFSLEILIIVNINSTLQNITKAIIMRYRQLLTFLMFLIVITYIFSTIAFFSFSKDFIHVLEDNQENACGSLFYCFLTHLEFGLRTDGGIGEYIAKISFIDYPGYFMAMFFFQFIFYILIIVIMLAVIGGSVIDTFSELRDKSRREKDDMENKCFICHRNKNEIEKYGETFEDHTTNVHNIWTYVDYMIGLKFVDPQETNAINSFVIEQLNDKKISWFPSFKPQEEEKNDEKDDKDNKDDKENDENKENKEN